MNGKIRSTRSRTYLARRCIGRLALVLGLVLSGFGSLAPIQTPVALAAPETAPLAQTSTLALNVISARTEPNAPNGPVVIGDPVTQYEYLINVDNTGNPLQPRNSGCDSTNAGYPDNCDWPSIREVPGSAPIFTQGDQADFGAGITLPDGKYLISVLADGYKMGGAHFTIPLSGPVTVELQPNPLPAATMRLKIFEDTSPVNGQFDAPAEHGLEGFQVAILDQAGDIVADVFGNSLCTTYNAAGDPNGRTDCLVSDANGDIVVPNLGPNRYDVIVPIANGTSWVETTTLEGSPSWDTWLAEGGTGLDNEFVVAGEPFPWTTFGFVDASTNALGGSTASGGIKGTIVAASVYLPQQGGNPWIGDIWDGFNGAKITGPVDNAYVALSDLQNGDSVIYVDTVNPDGSFQINNVPDGNYLFTWWDSDLHYILDWIQVTVSNGQMVDLGTPYLTGWFTPVEGYVFDDLNENGVKDAGEPGLANYPISLRDRDNSEIDRQSVGAVTDQNGYYVFEKAYPLTSWLVLEAYNDRFYGTGVTFQVDNQPSPTTVLGNGVDVGLLPVLGQPGRLDWGVRPYDPTGTSGRPRNGGIVGTVTYDVTRNEFDARYSEAEPWQPSIPGLPVNLYAPIFCGTNLGTPCDALGFYELAPDGSYAKGNLLNSTTTEYWEQPVDCTPRGPNGNELLNPQDQQVLVTGANKRCLEGPVMGTQFQADFSTVDGNYGFGDGCFGPSGFDPNTGQCFPDSVLQELPGDDYLVEVVSPLDTFGRPLYQVTREEDINVFGGDQFIPAVPPPACAGALHTVDVAGVAPDGPNAVINTSFAAEGGSPFEGMDKPLCDVKLVTLANGKSIAPTFNFFTRVPIPGKWKGYIIDDLSISTDPKSLNFGEKAGIEDMPIGIYDFTNKKITTITSDPNGVYEVLLPSTHTVNCPSPSGVCSNVYYMLGNDPGQPGDLNANYNNQYRTIGASFEVFSGLMLPSDLAPTRIVPGVLAAGSLYGTPPQCTINDPNNVQTPELFAVSQPYHDTRNGAGSFTIQGQGFGSSGTVMLGDNIILPTTSWSDTSISVTVPANTTKGRHQLSITRDDNGNSTVNGLTFHVLGRGNGGINNPRIFEVGPGRAYSTIQAAVDAASATNLNRPRLVVVYPDTPVQWNPTGAYFENVIINSPVAIQGVGPGGIIDATGNAVLGSAVDGRGVSGDTAYAEAWRVQVQGLTWSGNQALYEGAVFYVLARNGEFNTDTLPAIDGLTIQGGDQQGFPNNLTPGDPTQQEFVAVQGGGIFVNAFGRNMQISNNILESNGGAYGGAIRIGTPHLTGNLIDNQNDDIRIVHNRIIANGGTNLAGAVALFNGTQRYEVAYNDVCGNFSAEYGGGISHYGKSQDGQIHHNRIYFNGAYDEGGGIMIAGELPADPNTLSPGAGRVDIYNNLVQSNLANDDGGGIRFLMAGNFRYDVYNNMIVNNVSTHEGGGVSLNDATNVKFYNNTVMKNITTGTAVTSLGQPAPAGLSDSRNSALLQATLNSNHAIFSDPLLFNNIFWDNRAGTFTGSNVAGIGLPGDPNPINYWDLGTADGVGLLHPRDSILQTTLGTTNHGSNIVGADPAVISTYDTTVSVQPWRGNPRFVDVLMVTSVATENVLGDYHIGSTSPAIDSGRFGRGNTAAPAVDFDNDLRPQGGGFDIGADERVVTLQTSVLDNFNRGNGGTGANWSEGTATDKFRVRQNTMQARNSGGGGDNLWTAATFGANQEAFATLTQIPNSNNNTTRRVGLRLKVNGANLGNNALSAIEIRYATTKGTVVRTTQVGQGWTKQATFANIGFSAGDQLAAQAWDSGYLSIYKNGVLVANVDLLNTATPWDPALAAGGGLIGVSYSEGNARFDDFGGGDTPTVLAASLMMDQSQHLGTSSRPMGSRLESPSELEAEANALFSIDSPAIADGNDEVDRESNADFTIMLPLIGNQ